MKDSAYLIDSNILIRWVKSDDRDYPLGNTAIERLIEQGNMLCYTSQNLGEFWNTCTRQAEFNGYGLSIEEADVRAMTIEKTLTLLTDSPVVHREWRKLIVSCRVSGVKVHVARLVAAMRVHGVNRILTFDERDFARYTQIEAWHPAVLLKQIS